MQDGPSLPPILNPHKRGRTVTINTNTTDSLPHIRKSTGQPRPSESSKVQTLPQIFPNSAAVTHSHVPRPPPVGSTGGGGAGGIAPRGHHLKKEKPHKVTDILSIQREEEEHRRVLGICEVKEFTKIQCSLLLFFRQTFLFKVEKDARVKLIKEEKKRRASLLYPEQGISVTKPRSPSTGDSSSRFIRAQYTGRSTESLPSVSVQPPTPSVSYMWKSPLFKEEYSSRTCVQHEQLQDLSRLQYALLSIYALAPLETEEREARSAICNEELAEWYNIHQQTETPVEPSSDTSSQHQHVQSRAQFQQLFQSRYMLQAAQQQAASQKIQQSMALIHQALQQAHANGNQQQVQQLQQLWYAHVQQAQLLQAQQAAVQQRLQQGPSNLSTPTSYDVQQLHALQQLLASHLPAAIPQSLPAATGNVHMHSSSSQDSIHSTLNSNPCSTSNMQPSPTQPAPEERRSDEDDDTLHRTQSTQLQQQLAMQRREESLSQIHRTNSTLDPLSPDGSPSRLPRRSSSTLDLTSPASVSRREEDRRAGSPLSGRNRSTTPTSRRSAAGGMRTSTLQEELVFKEQQFKAKKAFNTEESQLRMGVQSNEKVSFQELVMYFKQEALHIGFEGGYAVLQGEESWERSLFSTLVEEIRERFACIAQERQVRLMYLHMLRKQLSDPKFVMKQYTTTRNAILQEENTTRQTLLMTALENESRSNIRTQETLTLKYIRDFVWKPLEAIYVIDRDETHARVQVYQERIKFVTLMHIYNIVFSDYLYKYHMLWVAQETECRNIETAMHNFKRLVKSRLHCAKEETSQRDQIMRQRDQELDAIRVRAECDLKITIMRISTGSDVGTSVKSFNQHTLLHTPSPNPSQWANIPETLGQDHHIGRHGGGSVNRWKAPPSNSSDVTSLGALPKFPQNGNNSQLVLGPSKLVVNPQIHPSIVDSLKQRDISGAFIFETVQMLQPSFSPHMIYAKIVGNGLGLIMDKTGMVLSGWITPDTVPPSIDYYGLFNKRPWLWSQAMYLPDGKVQTMHHQEELVAAAHGAEVGMAYTPKSHLYNVIETETTIIVPTPHGAKDVKAPFKEADFAAKMNHTVAREDIEGVAILYLHYDEDNGLLAVEIPKLLFGSNTSTTHFPSQIVVESINSHIFSIMLRSPKVGMDTLTQPVPLKEIDVHADTIIPFHINSDLVQLDVFLGRRRVSDYIDLVVSTVVQNSTLSPATYITQLVRMLLAPPIYLGNEFGGLARLSNVFYKVGFTHKQRGAIASWVSLSYYSVFVRIALTCLSLNRKTPTPDEIGPLLKSPQFKRAFRDRLAPGHIQALSGIPQWDSGHPPKDPTKFTARVDAAKALVAGISDHLRDFRQVSVRAPKNDGTSISRAEKLLREDEQFSLFDKRVQFLRGKWYWTWVGCAFNGSRLVRIANEYSFFEDYIKKEESDSNMMADPSTAMALVPAGFSTRPTLDTHHQPFNSSRLRESPAQEVYTNPQLAPHQQQMGTGRGGVGGVGSVGIGVGGVGSIGVGGSGTQSHLQIGNGPVVGTQQQVALQQHINQLNAQQQHVQGNAAQLQLQRLQLQQQQQQQGWQQQQQALAQAQAQAQQAQQVQQAAQLLAAQHQVQQQQAQAANLVALRQQQQQQAQAAAQLQLATQQAQNAGLFNGLNSNNNPFLLQQAQLGLNGTGGLLNNNMANMNIGNVGGGMGGSVWGM